MMMRMMAVLVLVVVMMIWRLMAVMGFYLVATITTD